MEISQGCLYVQHWFLRSEVDPRGRQVLGQGLWHCWLQWDGQGDSASQPLLLQDWEHPSTFWEVTASKFYVVSFLPEAACPATPATLFCSEDLVLIQPFFGGSGRQSREWSRYLWLISRGARSLLVRERGVNEVGGSRCCPGFGNWSRGSRTKAPCGDCSPGSSARLSCLECPLEFPWHLSSSRREGLVNHSAGSDRVPTNTPDCSTGTPEVELACWSAFCLLYFIGRFWETMSLPSSEWEFVLVRTGNNREADFFFMVIGSRWEPFAFTSESLSGVCTAVIVYLK